MGGLNVPVWFVGVLVGVRAVLAVARYLLVDWGSVDDCCAAWDSGVGV